MIYEANTTKATNPAMKRYVLAMFARIWEWIDIQKDSNDKIQITNQTQNPNSAFELETLKLI